jgi:hypothetical protein
VVVMVVGCSCCCSWKAPKDVFLFWAEAVRVERLLPLSNEGQRGGRAGGLVLDIKLEMDLIISLDLSTF